MSENNRSSVFSLTGLLYDAAGDVSAWPRFLSAFAAGFDASAAQVVLIDERASRASFHSTWGIPPEVQQTLGKRYLELALHDDPRSPYWLHDREHPGYGRFSDEEIHAFQHGRSLHCRMLFTDAQFHTSKVYREVCEPAGIEYCLYRPNSITDHWSASVGLMRRPNDRPFTRRDCAHLDLWGPHLDRALEIHRQLTVAEHDRQTVFDVLDALSVGLFIVDGGLRVLFSNVAARAILGQTDNVRISRRRLRLRDAQSSRRLAAAVAAGGEHAGGGIPIAASDIAQETAYSLLVMPLWTRLRDTGVESPSAVVLMARCDREPMIGRELLQRMWSLTHREAAVLQQLVGGRNLGETAAALGVTVHTVRKHLKAIFAKTTTASQTELVRVVASSAVWFGAGESAPGNAAGMI